MDRNEHRTPFLMRNFDNNGFMSIVIGGAQALDWLSPRASRERHQDLSEARVDGVGDWLLATEVFSSWRTLEDLPVKPVLFGYGDPGIGKTFIRYEQQWSQAEAILKKTTAPLS